jgi:hypothetical protein
MVPGKDLVLSEYRGSSVIERYIDPNDPRLPDFARVFASNPEDEQLNIDQYYRMRVVSTKTYHSITDEELATLDSLTPQVVATAQSPWVILTEAVRCFRAVPTAVVQYRSNHRNNNV